MSNKRVKKKVNKKNTLILLTAIGLSILFCYFIINHLFVNNKVESTNITSSNIENNVNKDDSSDEKATLNKFKVVIDASYGGSDGGSKGYNGILQKDINLGLALKIKDVLERYPDIDVVLTRKDDSTMSIDKRIEVINNSNANFLVSIMQNTEGTKEVSGVETYVLPKENSKSNLSLGYILQQSMTMYINTKDRGVLAKNMDILLKSNIPGAVVNTGFISNKEEGSNLASDKYQERMAEGISQGILSYIDRYLNK